MGSEMCIRDSSSLEREPAATESDAELAAERLREIELGGGLRTKAMIDAVRRHRKPQPFLQARKHVEQRRGIAPTGNPEQHVAASLDRAFFCERALHDLEQCRGM